MVVLNVAKSNTEILRRYDKRTNCRWNFFTFSWVAHYKNISKNLVKKTGVHSIVFSVIEIKKIKNITKFEQKFLFTFLLSFCMAFLTQRLINTINVWFNFVFGSFFEQDHLWNLIILGVYGKEWPKCARILKQKLTQSKIWSMIFFSNLDCQKTFPQKGF